MSSTSDGPGRSTTASKGKGSKGRKDRAKGAGVGDGSGRQEQQQQQQPSKGADTKEAKPKLSPPASAPSGPARGSGCCGECYRLRRENKHLRAALAEINGVPRERSSRDGGGKQRNKAPRVDWKHVSESVKEEKTALQQRLTIAMGILFETTAARAHEAYRPSLTTAQTTLVLGHDGQSADQHDRHSSNEGSTSSMSGPVLSARVPKPRECPVDGEAGKHQLPLRQRRKKSKGAISVVDATPTMVDGQIDAAQAPAGNHCSAKVRRGSKGGTDARNLVIDAEHQGENLHPQLLELQLPTNESCGPRSGSQHPPEKRALTEKHTQQEERKKLEHNTSGSSGVPLPRGQPGKAAEARGTARRGTEQHGHQDSARVDAAQVAALTEQRQDPRKVLQSVGSSEAVDAGRQSVDKGSAGPLREEGGSSQHGVAPCASAKSKNEEGPQHVKGQGRNDNTDHGVDAPTKIPPKQYSKVATGGPDVEADPQISQESQSAHNQQGGGKTGSERKEPKRSRRRGSRKGDRTVQAGNAQGIAGAEREANTTKSDKPALTPDVIEPSTRSSSRGAKGENGEASIVLTSKAPTKVLEGKAEEPIAHTANPARVGSEPLEDTPAEVPVPTMPPRAKRRRRGGGRQQKQKEQEEQPRDRHETRDSQKRQGATAE